MLDPPQVRDLATSPTFHDLRSSTFHDLRSSTFHDLRSPSLSCAAPRSGAFSVDEPIYDYSQADLENEDVFLLDAHTAVFVWIGANASPDEREGGLSLGTAYALISPHLTPAMAFHMAA